MSLPTDKNGNARDENGRFVSIERYFDRILEEREKQLALQLRATEKALLEAKESADRVSGVLTKRIEMLESGGAPFASRLDEAQTKLQEDVDTLSRDAVKTQVLDAIRDEQASSAKRARTQVFIGGGLLLLGVLVNFIINVLQTGG